MDTLTIMPAPGLAAASDGALRGEGNEPQPVQSFGRLLAEQSAPAPSAAADGAEPSTRLVKATDGSDIAGSEQDADAQEKVAHDETPTDSPSTAGSADCATDADTDDAGRIAAAAALVQWLAVASQPVTGLAETVTQSVMVAPVPTTASAAGGDGAAAGASASSPDLIATIASAQGAEEKAADPDPQSQSQPTLPVDLQTRAAPVGEGFQGLLSQPLHLVQSPPAATATAHAPGSVVDSPVGDHAWAQELGTRLAVMTARGEQSGSLKLNPEHLGPLEVQIRVKDTDVTVAFGAQHADTRTALNEALPRLREMFAQSGLQLTDAGVSRDGTRQALPSQPGRSLLASRTDAVSAIETALPLAVLRHTGMIDALA